MLRLNIILNKQDNNFFFFLNTGFQQIVHDPIETSCMYTFSQITHTSSVSRKWIQFNCPVSLYRLQYSEPIRTVYHASRIPPMTIIVLLYSVMCLIVSVHCTCAECQWASYMATMHFFYIKLCKFYSILADTKIIIEK